MSDYINPYRLFYGAMVPNWLMEQPNVSSNAKLCYARLAQFAGASEDGVAWPTLAELCQALAWSETTVWRALKELERLRLIESEQRGLNRPNLYRFLDHPWIRRRTSVQTPEFSDVKTPERADVQTPDLADLKTPSLYQESSNFESPPEPGGAGALSLAEARGLVDEWWDRQAIKPSSVGKSTLAKRVQRLHRAGWPETLIAEALDIAENFTEAALEGRLRRLRSQTTARPVAAAAGGAQAVTVPIHRRPHADSCVCGGSGWLPVDEQGSSVVPCPHT